MSRQHFARHPRLPILALCAALLLALAGTTGAAAANAPQTWQVRVGAETPDHALQGMVFLPGELWIHQGDTVTWTAASGEPHTVTFLAPGQPRPDLFPAGLIRTPGTTFDGAHYATGPGVSYLNSGLLTTLAADLDGLPAYSDYSLTFTAPGDFTYLCLLHPGMIGTVHVLALGARLPSTPQQYNAQANRERARVLAEGRDLMHQAREQVDEQNRDRDGDGVGDDGTVVAAGIGNDMVDVMRFIRPTVRIHAGETVTFANLSMAPHTVTIGDEQPCPGGPAQCPYGDPAHYTGGDLSSGLFFGGQSFSITFATPGTYRYYCALHDFLGMVGTVIVLP